LGNFGANADTQTRITISEQEKEALVQGIVDSACKMMERIITRQSPRKRALSLCKPHKQSKTAITRDTILFNNLTKTQRLPARPRDFRISLAEEQKDILDSEISDILSSLVHKCLLEPKRDKFPFPRGRPKSEEMSGIAKERRGALSYYTYPQIRKLIDEILSDSSSRELIDKAILNSEGFYSFLKYSFEVHFYQMKEDEQAFRNTMSPAIRKYGLAYKRLEELDGSYILAKDLTPDKIDRSAKGYTINTMNKLRHDGKSILYTVAALFSIFNVYSSGNLKEK
jgi:hypothetical protein